MKDITQLGQNECVPLIRRKDALKFLNHIGKSHLISKWSELKRYYFPIDQTFRKYDICAVEFFWKNFLPEKQSIKKRVAKLESDYRRLNDLLPDGLRENEEIKLQLNKWYWVWCSTEYFLARIINEELYSDYFISNDGKHFSTDGKFTKIHRPATKEEVEAALAKEAEKRELATWAFKQNAADATIHARNKRYWFNERENILWSYGVKIFDNGKWAEIVSEPTADIDWSVPAVYENESVAIFCTGEHSSETFSGIIVSDTHDRGRFEKLYWNKSAFKPSSKTIKIE